MRRVESVDVGDGLIIRGDASDGSVGAVIHDYLAGAKVNLIYCDPPYGNVVAEDWDRVDGNAEEYAKVMAYWTRKYSSEFLDDGGAFYVWGGIGEPGFRPFFEYIRLVELEGDLQMSSLITWSKKRAYGTRHSYLFTREELAYFVKGDRKHPKIFNIPLLDQKRGYAGFNAKYAAKSEYLRRTNVWTDITELFRGKVHPTEKPSALAEVAINTHTNPGDVVIDMFAGSGSTGVAARNLGRKFVLVERDDQHYETICGRLPRRVKIKLKRRGR